MAEPFGAGTMTPGKEDNGLMVFGDEERELQALDDWGIEIDADGNIVPVMEEPQLPRLPQPENQQGTASLEQDQTAIFDEQGDVVMSGVEIFHSDPPVAVEQGQEHQTQDQDQAQEEEVQEGAVEEEVNSGGAPIRVQRRRRRPILALDDHTKVTRQELKSWSTNYLANAEQSSQRRHGTTANEARKNAFNLIFGRGIGGVGFPTGIPGIPHPLAPRFAGEGLHACLLGIIATHPEGEDVETPRGRRRSALEALELDQDDAERRVRRRLSDDEDSQNSQHAQPQLLQDDDVFQPLLGDDDELPPVEVGRRAGSILPDIPSDVPWNRPSSQIPSSSIKGAGSKPPSRQVSASPLHGRGSLLIPVPDIERFSDDAGPFVGGSDGFAPLHSGANSFPSDPVLPGGNKNMQTQSTSQPMRTALDREGQNFLGYVESVAREKGHRTADGQNSHSDNNDKKHWVEFDSLFEMEDRKRAVVAQAFYHVLSLATKNVVRVRQDGQGGTEAFGTIHVGVDISMTGIGDEGGEDGVEEEGMDMD